MHPSVHESKGSWDPSPEEVISALKGRADFHMGIKLKTAGVISLMGVQCSKSLVPESFHRWIFFL